MDIEEVREVQLINRRKYTEEIIDVHITKRVKQLLCKTVCDKGCAPKKK